VKLTFAPTLFIPSTDEDKPRAILVAGVKSLRTVLSSMVESWKNPSLAHFAQPCDIVPVDSLPIASFEWLYFEPVQQLWTNENNSTRKSPCSLEKHVHALPCVAYNTLKNERDGRFKAIIVEDTMDNEGNAKMVQFMQLPNLTGTNSFYWIHTRYLVTLLHDSFCLFI
jgi:hypothetical protein